MSEERKTVRVRIAVAVSRTGAWAAYGWQLAGSKPRSDSDFLREIMDEDVYGVDATHYLEADVPIPQNLGETSEGEVTP